MEGEAFADAAIAECMNANFIPIKVDREERPDLDSIYMQALQMMTGQGGWPLNIFLTPDELIPFYGGTYFPVQPRYGRPGFLQILEAVRKFYDFEKEKLQTFTSEIVNILQQSSILPTATSDSLTAELLHRGIEVNTAVISPRESAGPSFPMIPYAALALRGTRFEREFRYDGSALSRQRGEDLILGGIFDHVGGGFHRYTVDSTWTVPHFEKMLYDNGQLLSLYGDAYAQTGEQIFAAVIAETTAWLTREMRHQSGGLFASQDADSEGEEGKFYVWTPAQIRAVLGPADAIFFEKAYGVSESGNFERGTSVLSRVIERGSDSDERALTDMRARLFEARAERVAPDTDEKILASWNALTVTGLLRAWATSGHEPAYQLACEVAEFLARDMIHEGGRRLWRVYKDGQTKLDGTLDDYALVARAFFDMAEATGQSSWWQRGEALIATIVERFYSEEDGVGVFYMTPDEGQAGDTPLVHRPESNSDGAVPAGSSVTVECLARMAHMAEDGRARDIAERYLAARLPQMQENVFASAHLLCALDTYLHGAVVVVTGGNGREELLGATRRSFAPATMLAGSWAASSLLADKVDTADGQAQAYVCRGQTCSAPVTGADELQALLDGPSSTEDA